MKIKKLFLLLPLMNLLFAVCKSEDSSINSQAIKKLEAEIHQDTPLQFATKPLQSNFTKEHFDGQIDGPAKTNVIANILDESFLRFVYNRPNYADMLSQDGTHIIEFLKLCNDLNLNANSAYIGVRLFRIKMMSCEIIDDTVVNQFLEEFPNQMIRYFEKTDKNKITKNILSKNIEKIILGHLNNQFLTSTEAAVNAKNALTAEISKLFWNEFQKAKNKKSDKKIKTRLRFEVIRFFETTLARTLWNPDAPETVWPSFLSIANGLQRLASNNIINNMDDLDSLLWELVNRFNFFLDLSGFCLPLNFYEEVEKDLEDKTVYFLESQEQDNGVKPKKEIFAEKLFHAKTKAYAYHKKGILPKF